MSSPTPPSAPIQDEYGVLQTRNIREVAFGQFTFDTWYGNGAYFAGARSGQLGTESATMPRKRDGLPSTTGFWLETLYVCDFCFKYTSDKAKMGLHLSTCSLNRPFPPIGTLVYADTRGKRLIKKVRGFRNELFCQNLSLFGKLFLDDKSVYYNVEAYDFYVLYGVSGEHEKQNLMNADVTYRPMGFFSKEVTAWEPDNNLACICIFPPYQRLHLGLLLIEFLYAAAEASGQLPLGPEFPLSPYGKQLYLRYWGKRIAFELMNSFTDEFVTLGQLAVLTGFRREDILFALEHMGILYMSEQSVDSLRKSGGGDSTPSKGSLSRSKGVYFYFPFTRLQKLDNRAKKGPKSSHPKLPKVGFSILIEALLEWCEENNVDTEILSTMLDRNSLLL